MLRPCLLAALGGLVTAGSVQPVGLWPLGLVGAGLLCLAWSAATRRTARALAGFSWAMALLLCTTLWVIDFQPVGYVVLALLGASFFTVAGAVVPGQGAFAAVGAAGAITVAEALRARIPFQGFPMGGLPQGQAGGPLAAVARIGGTTLVTLVATLIGAGLALCIPLRGAASKGEGQSPSPLDPLRQTSRLRRRSGSSAAEPPAGRLWGTSPPHPPDKKLSQGLGLRPPSSSRAKSNPIKQAARAQGNPFKKAARAGALILASILAVGVGAATPAAKVVGSLRVAAVQGGGPRGTRGVETANREVLDRHLAASRTIAPGKVDVVVWPEDAVSLDGPVDGSPEGEELAAEARRLGAVLLVGVVEDVPPRRFRNAEVAFAPDGRIVGRYDKVHRVPFGEYAPLREVVARLADLSLLPRDAIPGKGPGILRGPQDQRLGVVISYEVFFGDRSRSAVRNGAEVLLAPTNAASYQTSQVPDQEVAAARLRAWETGRDVVQVSPTGFSAFVSPGGRVSHRTDLGAQQVITASVPLRSGTTPYMRTGDRPWLVLAAACLAAPGIAGAFTLRRRRGYAATTATAGTSAEVDAMHQTRDL